MFDPIAALTEYIRQPSVSTDPAYAVGMEGARRHLVSLLDSMGLGVEVIATAHHPVVLARREGPASWPHVIIYGHYDVQPPDPLNLWTSPPFEPETRGNRIFGRGAADNKGPQLVHIAAAARLIEEHPDLPLRLTFLVEGEEEIGSPSFSGFLSAHHDILAGDMVLLSDTLSPSSRRIAITTGLRGVLALEVELIGPRMDLHSGIHGGAVLNPLQALVDICSSLHDREGRVNIPGFYDDVIPVPDWERQEVMRLGFSIEEYRNLTGVKSIHTVDGISPHEATRFAPTLEFNGIGGGYQGEGSKTIIPHRASAKITCRLVPNQDYETILKRVAATLQERCPAAVEMTIKEGGGGGPYRVVPPGRPDTPTEQSEVLVRAFGAADRAIEQVFGERPLYLREGGSIPVIEELRRVLGMDSLMIGMFTPEDNLHAPDESMDLALYEKGIEVSQRILSQLADTT